MGKRPQGSSHVRDSDEVKPERAPTNTAPGPDSDVDPLLDDELDIDEEFDDGEEFDDRDAASVPVDPYQPAGGYGRPVRGPLLRGPSRGAALEVSYELGRAANQARERGYRTYALLALLAAVAAAAVVAGAAVDNPIFWAVAATVFFMAMAGLVAYAAKGLGIFAEMAELIRLRHDKSQVP